jgi:hypothetical protein
MKGLTTDMEYGEVLPFGRCRKVKFYYPLPESPSGRPLIEAPNRAVLANSWNGYEGYLII